MALLDVSLVTKALINLLTVHIGNSSAWQGGDPPNVTAQRPDELQPKTLGVHLYHVCEDPYLKNQPPAGNDSPPVRFTPMGLQLFYQLSAVGEGADGLANPPGNRSDGNDQEGESEASGKGRYSGSDEVRREAIRHRCIVKRLVGIL